MQAILITAYKNYNHLKDIITFFDKNYSIYIHLDKKNTFTKDEIFSLTKLENVRYLTTKYNVNWGGINHLLAILDIMNKAKKDVKNNFFHLITGHDYPIKNLTELSQFYLENKNSSFMEYHKLPYEAWKEGGLDRLNRYNLYDLINAKGIFGENLNKRFLKIQTKFHIKRLFNQNFPHLYGGSTYWTMSREAIDYIFEYMNANPQYLKRFKFSFCSEEIFFQTILLNSRLKDKIINNNKRFIIWENRNGNFPANLDKNDINIILSSDALFARKFEFPVSKVLLDQLKCMFQSNLSKY